MSARRAIFFVVLGIVLQGRALAAAETKQPPASPPLAMIAGEPITEAEVEALVGPQLAELRQKTFQLRSQGLDELIAQRLAEREAKRRGLTVEGLVKVEVDDKVVVTDADLKALYEANKARFAGQSEAEALKQIEPAVRQQKRRDRQMTFVHEMRAAASVTVLLEPLRAELHVPAGAPVRGSDQAPVTIVEFSDFQCPYCVRAQPTLKRVREAYGEKVRFVFVDFPLDIHPQAKKAHEAAACAHEQGKFWPMYDRLFTSEGKFQVDDLKGYAGETGLDADGLRRLPRLGTPRRRERAGHGGRGEERRLGHPRLLHQRPDGGGSAALRGLRPGHRRRARAPGRARSRGAEAVGSPRARKRPTFPGRRA